MAATTADDASYDDADDDAGGAAYDDDEGCAAAAPSPSLLFPALALYSSLRALHLEPVETACQEALAAGLHGSEVILNLLGRRRQRSPQTPITPPEALRHDTVPVADCARHDRLRPGSEGISHGAP